MKQDLRLGFTDTFENCKKFFTHVLSQKYNIIHDDIDPDYLIFGDPNFGTNHYQFQNCKKKIFFTGENVRPSYFMHDHAITFDFENSPRHYRLPLYVLEMWAMTEEKWTPDFLWLINGRSQINFSNAAQAKTEFCSFVQSNPNVQVRNDFFHLLDINFPGRVKSSGPHLNNTGYVLPRYGGHTEKIKYLNKFKFNIAFENGSYPGYVTEKLLNAYYALTIPIYWGSPNVHRDFNPRSMIVFDPSDPQKTLLEIAELDQDPILYEKKLALSPFKDNIPNEYIYLNNFINWWDQNVYVG